MNKVNGNRVEELVRHDGVGVGGGCEGEQKEGASHPPGEGKR